MKRDWDSVTEFIQDEMKSRETSKFRRKHERIWKEVDRQVSMEPLSRSPRDKRQESDWRNSLELGELSRASEIISADIRRLSFPQTRAWFESHVDVGDQREIQKREDGRLRAFMTQQHLDFGYKSRVDLSIKEALHHGSYVATVEWENSVQVADGSQVSVMGSPVWVPHSMWNCFPDNSAGIKGHNTFYQGSMIIRSYKPVYQVKRMKSPDPKYPFFNLNKIEKQNNKQPGGQETEDCELIYYYGDLVIPRKTGKDILLLNSRAILANGTIIHYMPNQLPYPQVIFNGWERLDVRDPYYVSPIVKFSADQKIGSILANRLLDAVDLKTEPPIIYDGNDPDFVRNGGPDIAPGAKTSTKTGANYSTIDIGDPSVAMAGLQFVISQIEAGTRVDRIRSGVSPSTEQTATEVVKQSQNAELSVVDFVDKHELHGLRPSLYMQLELNRRNLKRYPFYNQELDAPDFEIMVKSELPKSVNFEIVGSKGVLGEERRQAQTAQVTSFWMGANPGLLAQEELAKEMYRDAGNKSPEKFLNISEENMALKQQFQQVIEQLQAEAQQMQQQAMEEIQKLNEELQNQDIKIGQLTIDRDQKDVEKAEKDVRIQSLMATVKNLQEQIRLAKAEQSLIDAGAQQVDDLRDALEALMDQIHQPKRIVYDETGKPVGVEIIQGEKRARAGNMREAVQDLMERANRPNTIMYDDDGNPVGIQ
jgi:hypothetical protein